jgi:ATP-independent RNA helicase DbpA
MSSLFSDLPLANELLEAVKGLGFTQPTPVQEKCIPVLISGRDLVGQSRTGSGKTAAFALPILQKIALEPRETQALILCPTRELAAQVARDFRRLGRNHKGLQVLVVAGGEPARPQREALARGVHITVGTPGRVLDLLSRGDLNATYLKTLVLDEADRMLDMGFEDEVKEILQETPRTRQTVFFSATFPPMIQSWSRKYQLKPEHIKIDDGGEDTPTIRHFMLAAQQDEKPRLLVRLLETMPGSALVFCNQKATVAGLVQELESRNISAAALHGDLEQRDRDRVLAMFRNGSRRVLVATDVAARGLDIADLDMVVCFDVPYEAAAYTHRVGRTGRAGKTGLAVSLAGLSERGRLGEFSAAGEFAIELVRLEQLQRQRPKPAATTAPGAMQTLYISGGRKDKLRPGDLLGALTGEAGNLKSADIGKIEIHDDFSYVALAKPVAALAAQRLKAGKIKGRRFLVKLVD